MVFIVNTIFYTVSLISSDIPFTTAASEASLPTTLDVGIPTPPHERSYLSDNTRMLLRRMPTILADICKKNMDHNITRQLLICMEPGKSAHETIQTLGFMRIMMFQDESVTGYKDALRQVLQWCTGSLTNREPAQRAETECISPKTMIRLADELCESVFLGKQPPRHPYNAVEERNNWLSITKYFPNSQRSDSLFTQVFVSLMKNHWKDSTGLGKTGQDMVKTACFLNDPDSERILFDIHPDTSLYHQQYEMKTRIYDFMRCIMSESGRREHWEIFGSDWTKQLVETLVKEGRGKIIPGKQIKVILIHGNGDSTPYGCWFPHVTQELEKHGITVIARQFPDTKYALASSWLPFLKNELRADENSILVGHSSGALAAMRFAEKNKILGSILVGGSHTDLGQACERLSGYFDDTWDWDSIKKNQQWTVLFASTDDPAIPIEESRFIQQKLNATYHEFTDRGHFDDNYGEKAHFPELVGAILFRILFERSYL